MFVKYNLLEYWSKAFVCSAAHNCFQFEGKFIKIYTVNKIDRYYDVKLAPK